MGDSFFLSSTVAVKNMFEEVVPWAERARTTYHHLYGLQMCRLLTVTNTSVSRIGYRLGDAFFTYVRNNRGFWSFQLHR